MPNEAITRVKSPANFVRPTLGEVLLHADSPMDQHAAWVYDNVYSTPFDGELNRHLHGIQHAGRVAFYVPLLANLYRHFDPDAATLTDKDIQLLQIAALFHDAGREADGEDLWDADSAIMCYRYLINIGISKVDAKKMAEAIANKDADTYYQEFDTETETFGPFLPSTKKNIFQKLIHDADCLDVIRVRDNFDATYLDFCKLFVKTPEFVERSPIARQAMMALIFQARELILQQGDFFACDHVAKSRYECREGYARLLAEVQDPSHPFHGIQHKVQTDPASVFGHDERFPEHLRIPRELREAFYRGELGLRAIEFPNVIRCQAGMPADSFAGIECSMLMRAPKIKTPDGLFGEQGNINRSTTTLGHAETFHLCVPGFVISYHDVKIKGYSKLSALSGYAEKKSAYADSSSLSQDELRAKMRKGHADYEEERLSGVFRAFEQNEAGIDFEPQHVVGVGYPRNSKKQAILELVYLKNIYERKIKIFKDEYRLAYADTPPAEVEATLAKIVDVLPIFEFSTIEQYLHYSTIQTDEDIFCLWKTCIDEFIAEQLKHGKVAIFTMLPAQFILFMFQGEENRHEPLDANYDDTLKQRITDYVNAARCKQLDELTQRIRKSLAEDPRCLFTDDSITTNSATMNEVQQHTPIRESIINTLIDSVGVVSSHTWWRTTLLLFSRLPTETAVDFLRETIDRMGDEKLKQVYIPLDHLLDYFRNDFFHLDMGAFTSALGPQRVKDLYTATINDDFKYRGDMRVLIGLIKDTEEWAGDALVHLVKTLSDIYQDSLIKKNYPSMIVSSLSTSNYEENWSLVLKAVGTDTLQHHLPTTEKLNDFVAKIPEKCRAAFIENVGLPPVAATPSQTDSIPAVSGSVHGLFAREKESVVSTPSPSGIMNMTIT